ncbi:hypothetical protein MKD33_21690, partial [Chromobacterium piscinae]
MVSARNCVVALYDK